MKKWTKRLGLGTSSKGMGPLGIETNLTRSWGAKVELELAGQTGTSSQGRDMWGGGRRGEERLRLDEEFKEGDQRRRLGCSGREWLD